MARIIMYAGPPIAITVYTIHVRYAYVCLYFVGGSMFYVLVPCSDICTQACVHQRNCSSRWACMDFLGRFHYLRSDIVDMLPH